MKKYLPILAPGMDVDAGAAVGPFGHHAGNQRDFQPVQQMGQAIDGDGLQPRIAEDHLVQRVAGRIAVVGRLHVHGQQLADRGDLLQEGDRLGLARDSKSALCWGPQIEFLAGVVPQGAGDLLGELIVQAVDQFAYVVGDVAQVQPVAPPVAGKDDVFQAFQDLDDHVVAGQGAMAQVGDRVQFRIGLNDPVGKFRHGLVRADVSRHVAGISKTGKLTPVEKQVGDRPIFVPRKRDCPLPEWESYSSVAP